MKKILITGGNGFIGRNLKESFERCESYEVYSPKKEELDLLNQGLVKEYLQKNKFDLVIHAAGQNTLGEAKIFESKMIDRNIRMFLNLLSCSEYYDKMYHFGSGAEYDQNNYIPNMTEEFWGKYIPTDSYGFSKYIISQISQSSEKTYNMRLFGVFGKNENWEHRFISNSICKVISNLPIVINQNVNFDYLYIDDLCEIMKRVIKNKPKYKNYNICTGEKIDLLSISKKIVAYSGKKLEITIKKEGLKKEYTGNNSRLISEIGEYKFIKIEDSIAELYKYYDSIKESIKLEKLLK